MSAKPFKSPDHKMIAFIHQSRDKWKERALDYSSQIRAFEVQVRDLEASRDHWRERYFAERDGARAPAGPPECPPVRARSGQHPCLSFPDAELIVDSAVELAVDTTDWDLLPATQAGGQTAPPARLRPVETQDKPRGYRHAPA
jgi:hypothetical protein